MLAGLFSLVALVVLLVVFAGLILEFPPVLLLPFALVWWFRKKWKEHVADIRRLAQEQGGRDAGSGPAGTAPGRR